MISQVPFKEDSKNNDEHLWRVDFSVKSYCAWTKVMT